MTEPEQRKKEAPYRPEHAGFDVEQGERAAETAERARKGAAGPRGAYADEAYVEEGPQEAAKRMGGDAEDVGKSVERARKQR